MTADNDNPAQNTAPAAPAKATSAAQSAAVPGSKTHDKQDQDSQKAAAGPAQPAVAKPVKARRVSVFGLLFNLLLVAGIAVAGFYVYEQNKAINVLFGKQNTMADQRNDTLARLDALQDGNQVLQTANQALQDTLAEVRQKTAELFAQQNADIARLQNELVSIRLRISTTNPGASQEWQLAEAASLLRLARQHLIISRNMTTAQALYIAADDVLKAIDDPAIFAVRETLAGELAAIRAVTEVDVSSLYLQLGAVADQVNSLQVTNDLAVQINNGQPVSLNGQATAAEADWFSRFVSYMRNTLNNYFVVRRRDVPIQPLMTPGQESVLIQGIRLQIEQGRTALLRGEQEVFSASLGQARDTVATYLTGDEGIKASILNTLDAARGRRIVTEVPPLNRSLAALEQILSAQEAGTTRAGN